ncbi:IclR family transcriptional regulator C-terminal domain-containing protein [Cupriavidus basilensis]|uniref:IclR family transcriptional regulator C-terminal domain-containing protein n=1 Tax=Cupriavidus basilensis TaxID=68895 RepID=A0ABT6AJP7_9BURK|nr:IclR family transcriptional regulator C-terminal domain-containing protein [Cupriavidus basilensis]MDF3832818.1 IclR family transcriptional regulator C-terminal domain-containing protein [Cupriavidus basilensis]
MNSPDTPQDNPQKRDELLDSLTKGLALLRLFASGASSLTVQDVAEQLDVTRAAARRLLLTLQHNGYLAQDGREFSITPRVMDLGFAYFASMNLPRLAGPYLKALSEEAGETCSLGVLDGESVALVAREEPPQILRVDMGVGRRMPAYAHSLGRVLLAGLDDAALEAYLATAQLRKLTPFTVSSRTALARTLKQVRSDGYCTLVSELVDGFAGISVPLRAESGKVVAGLGFSMVLGSRDKAHLVRHHLPALRRAAGDIETLLRRR